MPCSHETISSGSRTMFLGARPIVIIRACVSIMSGRSGDPLQRRRNVLGVGGGKSDVMILGTISVSCEESLAEEASMTRCRPTVTSVHASSADAHILIGLA